MTLEEYLHTHASLNPGGVDGALRTIEYGAARPAAQHAAARLLQDLASSHAPPMLSHPRTASRLASALLTKGASPDLQCAIATALKHLCSRGPAQSAVLGQAGILQALARMIQSQDPALQVAGARLLARLAPQVDLPVVVGTGAVQSLCARGLSPSSGARVMGHTPRSAAILSVCQLLLPALEGRDDSGDKDGMRKDEDKEEEPKEEEDTGAEEAKEQQHKEVDTKNGKSHQQQAKGSWALKRVLKGRTKAAVDAEKSVTTKENGYTKEHESTRTEEEGSKSGSWLHEGTMAKVAPEVAASLLRVQGQKHRVAVSPLSTMRQTHRSAAAAANAAWQGLGALPLHGRDPAGRAVGRLCHRGRCGGGPPGHDPGPAAPAGLGQPPGGAGSCPGAHGDGRLRRGGRAGGAAGRRAAGPCGGRQRASCRWVLAETASGLPFVLENRFS